MRARFAFVAILCLAIGSKSAHSDAESDKKAASAKAVCQADCKVARRRQSDMADSCSSAKSDCREDIKQQGKTCIVGCKSAKDADNDACNKAEAIYRTTCREAIEPAFDECKKSCDGKSYSCDSAKAAWETEACSAADSAKTDADAVCNAC